MSWRRLLNSFAKWDVASSPPPAALDKCFVDLKPALAEAVRDHSASRGYMLALTSKGKRSSMMTHFALYVELVAKPGRAEDVATFLANARSLVIAETGTIAWFAVRFDKATFAIFDAFNDEAGG